jgi:enoyl-CoA hydratase/carnithine racemase
MAEGIEISVADGVQTIRFARPEKKNALTSSMYAAMNEALARGDVSDAVAAHLFVGSGGIFTAGNDINDFLAETKVDGGLGDAVVQFIRMLPVVKKPMIAAVEGLAVGIGTTLLFHCDLVYAAPTAALVTPFLDLGIVPEAGSGLPAPLRMGYARAFELLVLGEPFPADRAREAGIVNAVVPSADLEETARKAARKLAGKPPEALALSRRLMRGDPSAIVARIDEEVKMFVDRLRSAEAKEAFSAFLEKRTADFSRLRRGPLG